MTVAAALLFLPLADTGLAIVRRTLQGHSFMVADHHHVHHQLLNRGLNVWQVLGCLSVFCLMTQALAWLAAVPGREVWTWTALAAIVAVSVYTRVVGHREWTLAKRFAIRAVSGAVATVLRQPLPDRSTLLPISHSHDSSPAAQDGRASGQPDESGIQRAA